MGKTNPLNDKDMQEFIEFQKEYKESDNSWSIDIDDINETTYDLSVDNPNKEGTVELRRPKEILDEMETLDDETNKLLASIKEVI